MTSGEWLNSVWWLPVWLIVVGGVVVFLSAPKRRKSLVRMGGTGVGAIVVSYGIALLAIGALGPVWLIILYPIVLALSALVWHTSRRHPLVAILLLVAVNGWMLLWLGFLLVTGGGGGHATS